MTDRILIKDAIVLTQDDSLGELPKADILIEGDTIAAVGPNLSADGAQVIDAAGDIVIPGFIDTHRHTWETSIRTCAPDYALITYFGRSSTSSRRTTGPTTSTPPTCGARSSASTRASRRSSTGRTS